MEEYIKKYAAMPLLKKGDLLGYVAISCNIIEELYVDGKELYNVIFKINSENFLSYNYKENNIVDRIFEDFEEAKKYSHELNNILLSKALKNIKSRKWRLQMSVKRAYERYFEKIYSLEEQEEVKTRSLNKNNKEK